MADMALTIVHLLNIEHKQVERHALPTDKVGGAGIITSGGKSYSYSAFTGGELIFIETPVLDVDAPFGEALAASAEPVAWLRWVTLHHVNGKQVLRLCSRHERGAFPVYKGVDSP